MPGPIVVLTVTFFTYTPFAVCGFALKMISMIAVKLAVSFSGSNEALPNGTWTMPAFSTRNSTLPAFCSFTAREMSIGHGADLRVRHEAAGAEDLTEAADDAHHVRASRAPCRSP